VAIKNPLNYTNNMNVQGVSVLLTSVFSIGTVFTLILTGKSGSAMVLSFAVLSALFALLSLVLRVSARRNSDKPKVLTENAAKQVNEKKTLTELLSDVNILLSQTIGESRQKTGDSLLAKILASQNMREMVTLVSEVQEFTEKSEKIISAISARFLTDTQIFLPLANSIFKAVPAKTEEAAFALMEKFLAVREASGKAAASAQNLKADLEDTKSVKSINFTAENSRSAVRAERVSIKELSQCTRENREHLRAMKGEIDAGLDLLKSITEITERSKLIAFNMSIEAARMGEKGRGVKVIVAELHKLNDRTFDFSRQVAQLLHRFRDYNTLLVNNMEEKASIVVSQVEKGIDAAEAAVETLITASERTETFTREIALMSEAINHGLDGVLESLQFQDITRQMIEGGQSILLELKKSYDESIRENDIHLDNEIVNVRFNEIKKRLIENAKTKGEKNALTEVRV